MARIVFFSSMPGSNWNGPPSSGWGFLASVAYFAAILGAASTGWTHGGFLGAILYALLALITFPLIFLISGFGFLVLYPLLASPGSWVATQLGWTSFGPYAERRVWLQRLSVLLFLAPLAMLLQQYPWSVLRILTGVATLGLALVVVLVCVLVLVMARVYRSAAQQTTPDGDLNSTFRWIKPDPLRLPPPSDESQDDRPV